MDDKYVEKMMDVLEVYGRPYDPKRPVVCFDEKSNQLLEEVRKSKRLKPGKVSRKDGEYRRKGTVNIFVSVEPKGKVRHVKVTKRRTKTDFAKEIKRLVETKYREAEKVIFVMDNLNTHSQRVIEESLGEEADEIVEKTEFHYTPKHGSWLNMAEIEIGVLSRQCLKRWIGTFQEMQHQVATWRRERNEKEVGINWNFTKEKARQTFKL